MKVLKHLARDLDTSTHALRIVLRKRYGKVKDGRWKWTDAKYSTVLRVLKKELNK